MAVILQGVLLGQLQVPAKSEKSVEDILICMGVGIARRTSRVWGTVFPVVAISLVIRKLRIIRAFVQTFAILVQVS